MQVNQTKGAEDKYSTDVKCKQMFRICQKSCYIPITNRNKYPIYRLSFLPYFRATKHFCRSDN